MDLELSEDLSIDALTRQFTAELAQRTQTLLGRAHDEVARLRAELHEERQRREQAEGQLRERDGRLQELEALCQREQEARLSAEQEVATIHEAIAAQLAIAEVEARQEQEAEEQRRRELELLREELSRERLRHDLLRQRLESLRRAATDLFAADLCLPAATPDLQMLATGAMANGRS